MWVWYAFVQETFVFVRGLVCTLGFGLVETHDSSSGKLLVVLLLVGIGLVFSVGTMPLSRLSLTTSRTRLV